MFHLPPQTHQARELVGDIATLANTLNPANAPKLLATWQAVNKARDMFAACSAAKRVAFVVLRADSGERWLISVGRRGGWRKEWNFGAGA